MQARDGAWHWQNPLDQMKTDSYCQGDGKWAVFSPAAGVQPSVQLHDELPRQLCTVYVGKYSDAINKSLKRCIGKT